MALSELTFQVKGSSAEPYDITFIKDGDSLTALCSCPAGQFGNFCKHRMAILDGNTKAVVSENSAGCREPMLPRRLTNFERSKN